MDALNEVYVMYYFNPRDEWPDHRMSEIYVYEAFEDAKQIPENRVGRTDWSTISPWRWRLGHYWVEKQAINFHVSPATRDFIAGLTPTDDAP